ncbi:MAG: cytochrome C [Ignavibacteriae bacterium HGW-Ignavibacteriae-1]|jgi:mono/diheme cytochrome c family protein|nr:MAG: cytochrome C [Ignavibacteriae bacterium HGW-Ignavibacteriae-1]
MSKGLRIIAIAIVAIIVIIGGLFIYISNFLPNISAAQDLKVEITDERVERGKYLANHVMLCMDCHAERDFSLFAGPPKPGTLAAGGDVFDHSMGFPGVFVSKNITPFGIGDWTDGELFRLITTGVNRDGDPIFPVMPYMNYGKMDPEDIKSVIAYLRTLEPIETNHPESKADFPMNLIMRTIPAEADMQPMPSKSNIVEYGKYLTNAAACADCHTQFEKGKFVGELLAGGREFSLPDGSVMRTPNLTPHATGLANWTEEAFVNKFKAFVDSAYVPHPVKPGEFQTFMPWQMYGGMDVEDLKAIYAYLRSIPPVDNRVTLITTAKK